MAPYSSYTDEQLLALLRESDEGAFTELYGRYWKKLLIRAQLLLESYQESEELVHDIFVKLWKKRETIVIENSFHTYIAAVLKYDTFKCLAWRKIKGITNLTSSIAEPADHSTQNWLDYAQLREELEKAVRLLPDQCQLVFRLSREQGMSDKEIAAHLQVSTNTVRTQMYRALKRLKTSLNQFFVL
jgi:RNA polymerase sigma-70 factor (ECF subfamily)